MWEITEPVLKFLEEEHGLDPAEFKRGYRIEQQCLTRALSRYHDIHLQQSGEDNGRRLTA